jgi:hypothetical protein
MSISFYPDIQSLFIVNIDGTRFNFEIQEKTNLAVPSIMAYTVRDIVT